MICEEKQVRKQERIIVWPIYLDSSKSRHDGRRVPKNVAVSVPRAAEVKDAAEKAGLKCELMPDLGYPKTPWLKMGMVLVEKKDSKNQTIMTIAKQLAKTRSTVKEQVS
jgi:signal recognition particle subunit SRP19